MSDKPQKRGHGRTKYAQSRYAGSSVYESIDDEPHGDEDDDMGGSSRKGTIYKVRKSKYVRYSPYKRGRTKNSDLVWTHDKYNENGSDSGEEIEYERTVRIYREGGKKRQRNDRWEHDKYEEERGDERRRKSSSSRRRNDNHEKYESEDDDEMDSGREELDRNCGYKVSVRGLSGDISTVAGLTKFFSRWGKIINCGIGRSGTSGYIVYDDKDAAKDAVALVTKTEYNGKRLVVSHDGLLIT